MGQGAEKAQMRGRVLTLNVASPSYPLPRVIRASTVQKMGW